MTSGDGFAHGDGLSGLPAYDAEGEKVGTVGQVYLDDSTNRPEWVTVKTGLFGMKESFVPLSGARRSTNGDLHFRYDKDQIKEAPRLEAEEHLDADEERRLYDHYGIVGTAATGDPGRRSENGRDERAGAGGPGRADEVVRSEERLRVGTEEHEAGRARLRKHVETEEATRTVPVSHDEARVVREPIRDGERGGERARIGDAEAEVTLRAEEPVVRKEAVPVERVRLETDKVTEQREVSDQVRKERVDYDADTEQQRAQGRGGKPGPRH
ncbi:PRC and DUF2382 domain-containing protein [Streptomyces sp. DT24]|uniref:PRC and DUF2382 domain-containing protein n=1 Tax=unclassified Streptomyces TaxID=2593676 RepID=UPI0023B9412E|nr:PRC and DUF2382 domain-containing protein [Streptomyces sp. AM 4-1-1]WEH34686.1 PRC and DUF2382 domain-containing protein [Streptomyces sp. AM 4-1-1]